MSILIINHREPIPETVKHQINAPMVHFYQAEPDKFDLDAALQRYSDTEVLVVTYNDLTAARLAQLPNLKAVILTTTAYEYVDIAYCRQHGIKVFNNTGYSQTAVAEHLLALLMAAARRIPLLDNGLRHGDFNQFTETGFEFYGKTLGIVGMGHIGQTLAHLCGGFGMNIIFYNRSPKTLPYTQVSLDTLARQSDAVALALPLSKETHGMLDKSFFSKMKAGSILASISADEILDKPVFEQAVADNILCAAGLDLHEPWPALQFFPQVVMTPVKGWYTRECMDRRIDSWVGTLNAFLEGNDKAAIVF